jgi:hypothetical protein
VLLPGRLLAAPPEAEGAELAVADGDPLECLLERPSALIARLEDERLHYPVSELAARYGASVEEETTDFAHVYPRFEPSRRERPSYWDQLPWA